MASPQPVGLRIKRARERLRWSQRQLAEALGVNVKSVDNWENGRTSPRSSIGALESVLGIDLSSGPPEAEGPLDDLKVDGRWLHSWEQDVAEEEDLPVELRRRMIEDSRAARAEAQARRRRQRNGERATGAA